MKPKKILVWEPLQHSACAFYRSKGVLEFIEDDTLQFDFWKFPNRLFQHDLFGYDAVMINRSYSPEGEQLLEWCKQLGLGVICDYDDDLFNVEPDNEKVYHAFADPENQRIVSKLLTAADLVTVTTDGLGISYKRYAKKVAVIPNAFNDHIFDIDTSVAGNNRIVLWRGGESHRYEIEEFGPEIVRVIKKFPTWKFVSFGFQDHKLLRKLGTQAHHQAALDLIAYFLHVKNVIRPAISIVPLRDSVFNHAKSNIAWQETTWAGATTVLPNQYQWRDLPAYIYKDVSDFGNALETALSNAENKAKEHAEFYKESIATIKQKFLLSEHNKNRTEIYRSLFK